MYILLYSKANNTREVLTEQKASNIKHIKLRFIQYTVFSRLADLLDI